MPAGPRLISLATAVPEHRLPQAEVRALAETVFDHETSEIRRLLPSFHNAGIETRYAARPPAWLTRSRGWRARHEAFLPAAVALAAEAAERCLQEAGVAAASIDVLVTSCSTGFATPSLDALLLDRLGLRRDVERLPLVGLGCAGGVLALNRGAGAAMARPGAVVLCIAVELCTLTFRPEDQSNANVIASALFGDGAGAALLSSNGRAAAPVLAAWGEHTWPQTDWVMGWRIEDDGLGVLFSPVIPLLIRKELAAIVDTFLARHGLRRRDLAGILPHPGGARVLDALGDALEVEDAALEPARQVLRRYGNMSGPTVLFVLSEAMTAGLHGRQLLTALGPGFTAGFLLLEFPAAA